MIVKVYSGNRGIADEPLLILRVKGRSVYLGDDPFNQTPVFTIEGNEIFSGAKEPWDQVDPIASVVGNQVYKGRVSALDVQGLDMEPLATIVGERIYAGRRDFGKEPVVVAEGGDLMSAACAAVYLLVLSHTRRLF